MIRFPVESLRQVGIALGLMVAMESAMAQAPRPPGAAVAIKPIEGPGGAEVTKETQRLLQRLGPFQIANTGGVPLVGGAMGDGFFTGSLSAADGRELFERRYDQGNLSRDSRQFADDVIFTLTGRPGIGTSQVAFSFSQSGRGNYQVYLCDFDGSNLRQITNGGSHVAPAISGDGRRLAHVTLAPDQKTGTIKVVDLVDGKPLGIRAEPAQRIETAFSPDGKQLAISMGTEPGPNNDLYLLKLPRGKPVPLTRTPVPETSPSWSPDGKKLVFAAPPAPGRSDLFILEIRGKTTKPLASGYAVAIDPAWSPDGNQIAFVAVEGERRTVCVKHLPTGRTQRLTSGSQPFWGADSRHLLFVASNGTLSTIQVDNGKIAPVITGGGRSVDPSWTR